MQTTITRKTSKHASIPTLSKQALQQRLQQIFEQADHQSSALVRIYQLIFPDWEEIERLEGFPTVGVELWKYICQLFIDFDQKHHCQVFKGGLWFNSGFSSSDKLGPWDISLDQCRVIYK